MPDVSKVITLGPASVTFNSVELGHTDESGVKVTRKANMVEANVGKFGKSPVRAFYNGEVVEVSFVLQETDLSKLGAAFPLANKVTNGTNNKLTFGNIAGTEVVGYTLVLASLTSGLAPAYNLTAAKAVPGGDFSPVYSGGKIQGWAVKFKLLVDEVGGTDGLYLMTFGDTSIVADAVAPTVSGVVPLDNAAGVAVGSSVVWTLSKNLDPSTVNTNSVLMVKEGTPGVVVAGTVTLSNNGASTTITFKPSVNMSGATKHYVVLRETIKAQGGVALVGYESDFTTA